MIIDLTTHKTFITPPCIMCHKTGTVFANVDGITKWRAGTPMQHALPELSDDEREQLINGTHPDCYERLFA
jgi:hypothetical protein